jgi:hypothetical protein
MSEKSQGNSVNTRRRMNRHYNGHPEEHEHGKDHWSRREHQRSHPSDKPNAHSAIPKDELNRKRLRHPINRYH